MNIQITPFAWVMCALTAALPVAAFFKTKYPSFLARARVWVSTRKKCEESPSTHCESAEESFFTRFIEQWFKLAFIFELFTFMFTNLGYFATVNDKITISYDFVNTCVLFLIALILACTGKFDKRVFWAGILCFIAFSIGIIGSAIRPYEDGVILDFDNFVLGKDYEIVPVKPSLKMFKTLFAVARLVMILSVAAKVFCQKKQWNTILEATAWFARFVIVYGIFEIIFREITNNNPINVLKKFFGETPYTTDTDFRYQGLFKEPSHYAMYLSLLGFMLLLRVRHNKYAIKSGASGVLKTIWVHAEFFAVVALMLVSTSFGGSAYVVLLLFMYFWFYISPKGKFFWTWGFLLLFAAAFLLVGFTPLKSKWKLDRLYERTSNFFYSFLELLKGNSSTCSSEGARLTSVFYSFKYFAARPLFGIGLSASEAHSTLASLLANTGLIGTACLIGFYAAFAHTTKRSAFFVTLIYFSLLLLGWMGFVFNIVLPVIFLLAEQTLSSAEKEKRETIGESSRKIKILMISGAMPPMPCGVGDYTAKLCCALQNGGDCGVVAVTSVGASATISGAETVKIRNEIQKFGGFSFLRFIRRILKEEKPDIVHFQFPSSQYRGRSLSVFLWLPLMLKHTPCRIVFTAHEYNDKKIPFITAPFMLCADKIITVEDGFAKKIARNLKPFIDKNKAAYVPIGSNIPPSRADEKTIKQIRERVLGGKTEQKILGYFGFIGEGKCFDMLLEACGRLKEQNALSCKIMIVGKIDQEKCGEEYYAKLAAVIEKYSLGQDIYETGYLPEAEVADYLKAADFFALPFKNGAACRNGSILAAAQEGRRIISSRGALTGEFFESGQFVLTDNSVAAWQEAIRAELSAKSAAIYEAAVPSWDEIAKEHARIYRAILKKPLIDGERTGAESARKRAKKQKTEGGDERSD